MKLDHFDAGLNPDINIVSKIVALASKVAELLEHSPLIRFKESCRFLEYRASDFGIDYAGKHVAQLMLHGTCIEVRITTGTFTDTELIKLCNGFVAIEEENPEESTYHMNSS